MERVIKAVFDHSTITVYQAYNHNIAQAAEKAQTFISPFKKERMTWVKPSFLWMMYRSGWASKLNQEHILKIQIKRDGFEWALKNSCLSSFDKSVYTSYDEWKFKMQTSPVRVQWDPERNIQLEELPSRSIQIGLSNIALEKYITDWIVQIEDITNQCKGIYQLIKNNKIEEAQKLLPIENYYPLPEPLALNINYSISL